jgi:hypothetical protein
MQEVTCDGARQAGGKRLSDQALWARAARHKLLRTARGTGRYHGDRANVAYPADVRLLAKAMAKLVARCGECRQQARPLAPR